MRESKHSSAILEKLSSGDPLEVLCRLVGGNEAFTPGAKEWEEKNLLEVAIAQRVHLLLAHRPRERGVFDRCPHAVREYLGAAVRIAALDDCAQAIELRGVLDRLAQANVYPILIKGISLAYTCYQRPYLRPRFDLDLLIRKQDVSTIRRVMEEVGYRRPNQVEGDRIQHQCSYAKVGPTGMIHAYDFHWRLANPELFAGLPSFHDSERLAVSIPVLGKNARGLGDVHALFLACIHQVAHHRATELLWLYDIHLLAQRLTGAGWEGFAELAGMTATRAICHHGLELAMQAYQASVPEPVMAMLSKARSEASAAFLRSGLREIDIQFMNFKKLQGLQARWQLVRQNLFPASSYMLKAYNVANRAWLPALYVHRILRGAPRWFRSATPRSTT